MERIYFGSHGSKEDQMKQTWIVLLTTLVLFSLLLAPAGTVQAQPPTQEIAGECPHEEPDPLHAREMLRSLPLECIREYQEAFQQDSESQVANGIDKTTGGPD